jgi:hypothetical protein
MINYNDPKFLEEIEAMYGLVSNGVPTPGVIVTSGATLNDMGIEVDKYNQPIQLYECYYVTKNGITMVLE